MRGWKDQSPFLLADPFDNAGHVALPVAAILEGAALVAALERAKEHQPLTDIGEEKPYRALRARKLGEAHQAVLVAASAIGTGDRKRVGQGKREADRREHGGRRII